VKPLGTEGGKLPQEYREGGKLPQEYIELISIHKDPLAVLGKLRIELSPSRIPGILYPRTPVCKCFSGDHLFIDDARL
jgi:hypothetical protein